jgi:AraC family transcriptional regulator
VQQLSEPQTGVIASMERIWKQTPQGVMHGSARTGVTAAFWRNVDDDQVLEVEAAPNSDFYIICLQMAPLDAAFFVDGHRRHDGKYMTGSVSFVRPGLGSRAIMRGRFSCMHIYVPPELVHDLGDTELGGAIAGELSFSDTDGQSSPHMMRVGQELLSEMRGDAMMSRLRTDALGLETAVLMLRHHSNIGRQYKPLRVEVRGGLAPWQVRRITEALSADLSAQQPLGALAAQVGLSPFHFSRAFRRSMGIPPHAYHVKLRIDHAQALLSGTNHTVTEIALAVGYESSQAFARAFLRQLGCTPSAFRRMCA